MVERYICKFNAYVRSPRRSRSENGGMRLRLEVENPVKNKGSSTTGYS